MSKFHIDDIRQEYVDETVVIVGNGTSLVSPLYDGSGEATEEGMGRHYVGDISNIKHPTWTINGGWFYHPQSCLGWSMDDLVDHTERRVEHPDFEWYLNLYKNWDQPIITSVAYDEYPCSVAFPLWDVLKDLKFAKFTETIQYMVAFAIHCKVKKIILLGCDYGPGREHAAKQASTERYLGIAEGRGIEVGVCSTSHISQGITDGPFIEGFYGYKEGKLPVDLKKLWEAICQERNSKT